MTRVAIAIPEQSERGTHVRAAPDPSCPAVPQEIVVTANIVRDIPAYLTTAWRELAADAAEPNSFNEAWYVGAGLRNLAAGEQVRLVEIWCREKGEDFLIGLMPLCVRRDYGRMRARHVQNWRHFHTFLGTPLVRRGSEQIFWTAVLESLDGADWAPGFLHLQALVADGPVHAGLVAAAGHLGRPCPIVHRTTRAMLESTLSPEAYYETTVRKKKRKELQRLSRRLADLGVVESRIREPGDPVEPWCDAFLALERSGWKGRSGSALSNATDTERFFRDAVTGAAAAGRLQFRRLDLDGRPIAMLVNFLAPPGSFSFKIAFDEDYARFSPGVLIQLDNLQLLGRDDIDWMDSCAAENHPMIESLWGERRTIIRVTVRLRGFRRGLLYHACRLLENGAAWLRSLGRWSDVSA